MNSLVIDIAFDIICPWCLIGKRQLDLAQAEFSRRHPALKTQCRWHGVQLLADLPRNGVPFQRFYEHRLGSAAAVAARQGQVRNAAATVGLEIHFAKIRTMPNTASAHQLLNFASQHVTSDAYAALLERLFSAYFVNGEDIGDVDTLCVIAKDWGLDSLSLSQSLSNPGSPPAAPYGMGHAGVPHFVFNGSHPATGAQPAEALLALMERATHQARETA